MKKIFQDPEIQILEFDVEDVILSSFNEDEIPWEDEL